MGIYAYANQQGSSFEDQYIALLRDTASMTSEELAKKHLNVDLTKPDFWQAGIDQVLKDVEQFMTLTENYVTSKRSSNQHQVTASLFSNSFDTQGSPQALVQT